MYQPGIKWLMNFKFLLLMSIILLIVLIVTSYVLINTDTRTATMMVNYSSPHMLYYMVLLIDENERSQINET